MTNLIISHPQWSQLTSDGLADTATLPEVSEAPSGWLVFTVAGLTLDLGTAFDHAIDTTQPILHIIRLIGALSVAIGLQIWIGWDVRHMVMRLLNVELGSVAGGKSAGGIPGLGVVIATAVAVLVVSFILTIPTWLAFTGSEIFPRLGWDPVDAATAAADPVHYATVKFTDVNAILKVLWLRTAHFVPIGVTVSAIANALIYTKAAWPIEIWFLSIKRHFAL